MKIKELKEILNRYEEDLDIYLEFPARYKAVDADRINLKGIYLDITPLKHTMVDDDKVILLTDT